MDPNRTATTILRSDELTCPSCVRRIEDGLRRTPGVAHGTVHFTTGRIEVVHDPEQVNAQRLVDAVAALGYRATPAPF